MPSLFPFIQYPGPWLELKHALQCFNSTAVNQTSTNTNTTNELPLQKFNYLDFTDLHDFLYKVNFLLFIFSINISFSFSFSSLFILHEMLSPKFGFVHSRDCFQCGRYPWIDWQIELLIIESQLVGLRAF